VFTTLKARNKIHETKMSVMMESEQASGARADVAEERFREEETRTLDRHCTCISQVSSDSNDRKCA